jgi:murein DD-endopeptidase MepM/ murein hydrolase activator NlpD
VVQPGDWLTVLARRFNVLPEALIAANNIQDPNHVEVGQVLVIPLSASTATTATVSITPTARPVAVRPAATAAPQPQPVASNMLYRAPQILYPENGLTLKYDRQDKHGGADSITLAWLPVSDHLESGKTPCSWEGQPNGANGFLWDRYRIEIEPPIYFPHYKQSFNIFDNDQGTNHEFSLLMFQPSVSYTWRVGVGRWCVANNYDNQDPRHQGFLGLVSPYTEPRTFKWNP